VAVAVEPVDVDPPVPVTAAYTEETLKKYLPEWALAPVPTRVDGPLIQVRRVAGSREPTRFPSLRLALNETKGTIEIADEGPFPINDFRVPGESRLIRSRPGFHPIIRIDRANLAPVWSLPGVIVLEGKSLILDSLDLIVNLRDLTAAQTSLFCCTGANLTVRNCTITLINPLSQPFTLVRADGTAARGSRVRFEKTLIRGAVSSGFDLGKGAVDVAVRETIFLGSLGPIVRALNPEKKGDQRFSSCGRLIRCSAAFKGPGLPASCSRKVPLPALETGLTGKVSRISSAAGRDIMPAARSKRCAYPASRRCVPRGTAPTRTAERFWRPGRSRSIWARLFPRTLAPLFLDANRRSLKRRHPGQTSGRRPYGPFRRPRCR
jgi:hypothetical protein